MAQTMKAAERQKDGFRQVAVWTSAEYRRWLKAAAAANQSTFADLTEMALEEFAVSHQFEVGPPPPRTR